MEDDKLKLLFKDFEPELSPGSQFLTELDRKLELVEILKKNNTEVKTQNRKAIIIAAFVGFVTGFLFSMALPYIHTLASDRLSALSTNFHFPLVQMQSCVSIFLWCVIGLMSLIISINTYEAARLLLRPKPVSFENS